MDDRVCYSNCELKRSNLAGLMYANGVCLFAESAKALQRVCDHVSTVIEEYGLKVKRRLMWSV